MRKFKFWKIITALYVVALFLSLYWELSNSSIDGGALFGAISMVFAAVMIFLILVRFFQKSENKYYQDEANKDYYKLYKAIKYLLYASPVLILATSGIILSFMYDSDYYFENHVFELTSFLIDSGIALLLGLIFGILLVITSFCVISIVNYAAVKSMLEDGQNHIISRTLFKLFSRKKFTISLLVLLILASALSYIFSLFVINEFVNW